MDRRSPADRASGGRSEHRLRPSSKTVASRLSWTEGSNERRAEVRRHLAQVQTGQHYSLFTWRGKQRKVCLQTRLIGLWLGGAAGVHEQSWHPRINQPSTHTRGGARVLPVCVLMSKAATASGGAGRQHSLPHASSPWWRGVPIRTVPGPPKSFVGPPLNPSSQPLFAAMFEVFFFSVCLDGGNNR